MRILFFTYDRADYHGGPVILLRRLLPELKKRGYTVGLLSACKEDSPIVDFMNENNIYAKKTTLPAYTEDIISWIFEETKKFKPDIFVPNISVSAAYAASRIRKNNIPTIVTQQSTDNFNSSLADFFALTKNKWQASALVCINEYLAEKAKNKSKTNAKITAISNGIELPKEIANQSAEKIKIAYIGRLVNKAKQVHKILDAFIYIAEKEKNVEFTFIGSGNQKENLIARVKKSGLKNKIFFTSALFDKDLQTEMLKHQIVVLLSDWEGLPGSLIDGMSCGLIPITLRTKGIEELVINGKNGFIVKNREEDFYKHLQILLGDLDKRKRMSRAAKEHISENYSIEKVTEKWIKLFKEIKTMKHS